MSFGGFYLSALLQSLTVTKKWFFGILFLFFEFVPLTSLFQRVYTSISMAKMPWPWIFKIFIKRCWVLLKKILGPKKFPSSLVKIAKKRIFWQKILLFCVMQENFFYHLKYIEETWVYAQNFFQNFLPPREEETYKRKLEIVTAFNLREVYEIFFAKMCILKTTFFEIFLSGRLSSKIHKTVFFFAFISENMDFIQKLIMNNFIPCKILL